MDIIGIYDEIIYYKCILFYRKCLFIVRLLSKNLFSNAILLYPVNLTSEIAIGRYSKRIQFIWKYGKSYLVNFDKFIGTHKQQCTYCLRYNNSANDSCIAGYCPFAIITPHTRTSSSNFSLLATSVHSL